MKHTIKLLGVLCALLFATVAAHAQRYTLVLTAEEAYNTDTSGFTGETQQLYYYAQLTNSDIVRDNERGNYLYLNNGEGAIFVTNRNAREGYFQYGIYVYVYSVTSNAGFAYTLADPFDFRTVEQIISDTWREYNGGPPPEEY